MVWLYQEMGVSSISDIGKSVFERVIRLFGAIFYYLLFLTAFAFSLVGY